MILISPIDQKPVWCRSFPYFRKTYQKVCLIHKQACRPVRIYLEVGTTVRSQPRAVATFKSVSSCGITFLLSNRAITDCVRQAALAKSFCVIPLLCRCLISRSIKLRSSQASIAPPIDVPFLYRYSGAISILPSFQQGQP